MRGGCVSLCKLVPSVFFTVAFCVTSALAGGLAPAAKAQDEATAKDRAITANRRVSRMRSTTQAQRLAAAQQLQRAAGVQATAGSRQLKLAATTGAPLVQAAAPLVPGQPLPGLFAVCNAPVGLANADYMGLCPNWSNSPLLRKFVDSLPGLGPGNANTLGNYIPIASPKANANYPTDDYYEIGLVDYQQQMHSDLPAATRLRGYVDLNATIPAARYLGPVIVARRDKPVRIKFTNMLGIGAAGRMRIPVDTTIMGAGLGPDGLNAYTQNRSDIHLHGGNTPWISDGTPHQWITPFNENSTIYKKGVSFQNVPDMVGVGLPIPSANDNDGMATYYYTNQQSGRLMFFHDHAYGLTRLNVYAGVAAGYLLTDAVEDSLITRGVIPGLPLNLTTNVYAYGIPLIIQDKTFVAGTAGTGTFQTDPTWPSVVPAGTQAGDLWFPHVYMTNQNPAVNSGANAMGRWDYGAWFWPPFTGQVHGEVPCGTLSVPGQTCPGTPNPSLVPEAFMDTPVVNGQAYPYVTLEAKPYRFRLLNATNDRHLNLQLYQADPLTVLITNGGSNYRLPPTVVFTPVNGGSGAAGTAIVSSGSVTSLALTAGGSGYTAPTVVFSAPQLVGGTAATGTAAMSGGVITGIVLISGGSGYTAAPTIAINDPTGTLAGATATITPAGALIAVTVTNPGTGYLAPPLVSFTNAVGDTTGSGAAATTSLNTEVKMLDAVPHPSVLLGAGSMPACTAPEPTAEALYLAGTTTGLPQSCWPARWPTDARDGGVPDPTMAGPAIVQIGTEGGLLPAPVVISSQPVNYNYNRRDIVVLNVSDKALFLGPAERADIIVDFSGYAGKTLILYNDAPAPVPAFDTRFDYYTGDPDQTLSGGAPTTLPGYGPNTRTIMQIRVVAPTTTPAPFSLATLKTELPKSFAAAFPAPTDSLIVPESAYNQVYNPTTAYADTYVRIQDTKLTFTPIGQTTAAAPMDLQPKAIQELFEPNYGRMNAILGVELPLTNFTTQTTIPFAYVDPPTEVLNDGQTQIWKITHNGVDTHAIHFHLFNVQVLNRVGWDGAIRPPDANELGWKETVRMNPLEDAIVAMRPMKQSLPFGIPESTRLLDPTSPAGSTGQFTGVDPLTNNPITVVNQLTNFGWEYVWHCHLLGHEENDMMRPVVFKVQPVAIPKSLTATATQTPLRIALAWTYTQNPANLATGFRIYRTQGGGATILLATLPGVAQLTFNDNAVAYSTSYSYKVVAFNATGASLPSIQAAATTPGPPVTQLLAPTNLTAPAALITTNSVTLTWSASTGATGYTISRSTNGGTTWTAVGTATGLTFRVTGLTTKTTYMFAVQATNGTPAATSPRSTPVTATTK